MAKVIINFIDMPDGRVRTKVAFDPPIENDDSLPTNAQTAAMLALEYIRRKYADADKAAASEGGASLKTRRLGGGE